MLCLFLHDFRIIPLKLYILLDQSSLSRKWTEYEFFVGNIFQNHLNYDLEELSLECRYDRELQDCPKVCDIILNQYIKVLSEKFERLLWEKTIKNEISFN